MDWKLLSTSKTLKVYHRLFLNQCYLCQKKQAFPLCTYCKNNFEKNLISCLKCSKPLVSQGIEEQNRICGECQKTPPSYDKCFAPYLFTGSMRTLIHQTKFHQQTHFIHPLVHLLCEHLLQAYQHQAWPQQLLFVPSHPHRIRERGFCQTQLIAKQLAQQLQQMTTHAPKLITPNPINKTQHTEAQHTLKRKDRLNAPRKSYQTHHPIAEHVAIVDDVMTTGSTIEAACQSLRQAGAKQIDVWVLARTADKKS